jgi:hypothetical protein
MLTSVGDSVVEFRSILTCPNCGHEAPDVMPADACVWRYDCKACGRRLKPKPGDCCVFCSYGSVPCPPIQAARASNISTTPCCDA